MNSKTELERETREKVERFHTQVQSDTPVQEDLFREIVNLLSDLQESNSTISNSYLQETQQYFESVQTVRSIEPEQYSIDSGKAKDIVIEFRKTVDGESVNRV